MSLFPGIVVAWVLFGLFLCAGGAVASRLLVGAPRSVRASATALGAIWFATVAFHLLTPARLFTPAAALGAAAIAALAAGARPRAAGALFRAALAAVRDLLAAFARAPLALRAAAAAGGLVVAARFARAAAAPPLCWDALTYHLVKAGLWVQGRGALEFDAPNAWNYYKDFPPGGDLLWAWAMLPTRSDLFLAPVNALLWLASIPPAYAAARELGAPARRAAVCALAIAFTPAAIAYFGASYVDNLSLALFLMTALFVIRAGRGGAGGGEVVLGCAAAGLAAGVKASAAPVALLSAAFLLFHALRAPRPAFRRAAVAGAALAAAGLPLVPALRMWARAGSPLYPFAVRLGGRVLAEGNAQLTLLLSGGLDPARLSWGSYLARLFLPLDLIEGNPHVNLGPSILLLAPLALAGAALLLARRDRRPAAGFLLIAALLTVLPLLSPDAVAVRSIWSRQSGRFLLPAAGALALLAAPVPGRAAGAVWGLALACNLLLAAPAGWGSADLRAVGELLLAGGLPAAAGVAAAFALARRGSRAAALALAALLALAIPWSAAGVRERHRDPIYADAASGAAFDVRRLAPPYAACQPLWSRFGAGPARTLAVTAGWDGMGHNWYLYPLLGRRLQNRLVYVSPGRPGEPLGPNDPAGEPRNFDPGLWMGRLEASGADLVVALPPETPEVRWMREDSAHFELLARGRGGLGSAHRFVP